MKNITTALLVVCCFTLSGQRHFYSSCSKSIGISLGAFTFYDKVTPMTTIASESRYGERMFGHLMFGYGILPQSGTYQQTLHRGVFEYFVFYAPIYNTYTRLAFGLGPAVIMDTNPQRSVHRESLDLHSRIMEPFGGVAIDFHRRINLRWAIRTLVTVYSNKYKEVASNAQVGMQYAF